MSDIVDDLYGLSGKVNQLAGALRATMPGVDKVLKEAEWDKPGPDLLQRAAAEISRLRIKANETLNR